MLSINILNLTEIFLNLLLLLWIYQYIVGSWKAEQEVILLSFSGLFVYEVVDYMRTI